MKQKLFWIGVGTLIIAIFAVTLYLPGYAQYNELYEAEKKLRLEIAQLEADNANLQKERMMLAYDDTYLESKMRERLGKVRPGEVLYKVIEVTAEPSSAPQQTALNQS